MIAPAEGCFDACFNSPNGFEIVSRPPLTPGIAEDNCASVAEGVSVVAEVTVVVWSCVVVVDSTGIVTVTDGTETVVDVLVVLTEVVVMVATEVAIAVTVSCCSTVDGTTTELSEHFICC